MSHIPFTERTVYQSPTVSVSSGNNAFGTNTTIISSAPFFARKMTVYLNTTGTAAGAFQVSVGSTVVVPFLVADGPNAFSPPVVSLDLDVPAGASVSVAAAAYNTTQSYSVTILLWSANKSEAAHFYSNPGISLSNANFQIGSAGASVWTPLGSALTLPARSVRLYQNQNNSAFTYSFGFGPNSSSITTIINGASIIGNSVYTWCVDEIQSFIPAGNILYAQQSFSGGAFWPLVKH